jgi:hypothetical protein
LSGEVSELVFGIGNTCKAYDRHPGVLSVGLMPLAGCFFHHQQAVGAKADIPDPLSQYLLMTHSGHCVSASSSVSRVTGAALP